LPGLRERSGPLRVGRLVSGQPFPAGAVILRGQCDGVYCRDLHRTDDVVDAMVGPSYRQAQAMSLCADCLADFAVAPKVFDALGIPPDVVIHVAEMGPDGTPTVEALGQAFRVWAKGTDGLYHEVKGELPRG
jgi:hypothetical protein